jgi:hypothetical protein
MSNVCLWQRFRGTALKAGDTEAFHRVVDDMYARVGGPDIDIDDATQELIDQAYDTLPDLSTR